jgi:hypothetical protein
MKLKPVLFSALALCSALGIQAVPVTFQVDMSYQAAQGLFDPTADVVEARGVFNGWSGGFTLTNSVDNPNIYSGTTDIAGDAGSSQEYKFVAVIAGSANWETINNRSFVLGSAAQTLPVVFFNNEWDGVPLNVTFQVNMASQIAAHSFDPNAGDVVNVRGEFNNWGTTEMTPDFSNTNIYVATVQVPEAPGSQVQYKFHIARASGTETWENDPNRVFAQTTGDQTLPLVFFNNVTGVPIQAALNLAVDMSAQIAGGKFDTNSSQQVWVRGNKVGWGDPPDEGLQLFPDASRSGIYTNTMVMNGLLTGDGVEFKFTIWDPSNSAVTWEDGANKSVTFTGAEPVVDGYVTQSYGPVYFNGITPADILSEDTVVTFRVDMNGATRFGGAAFDTNSDAVYINGTFVNNGSWGPWGTGDATWVMFDDGVDGGDTNANDGIYSIQVTLPKGSPTKVTYKYGIGSEDNEAASGNDHVRYVRSTGTYVMPLDKFGVPTQETAGTDIGKITVTVGASGHLTLTWNGQPGVKLQKVDLSSGSATDVAGTDGASSADIPMDGTSGFYRLVKP